MRAPEMLLVIGLLACNRGAERSEHIPVERDGTIIAQLPHAAADLWRWCDDNATAVVVQSSSQFVHGLCALRETHKLALTRETDGTMLATLVYTADGSELSRARSVTSIRVVTRTAPAAFPALTIRVTGRSSVTVDDAALAGLEHTRSKRGGVPLAALLSHAGVARPRAITVRGATEYVVDPAWVADPAHALTLRRNNRGELRFADETEVSRTRVSAVTEIVIEP